MMNRGAPETRIIGSRGSDLALWQAHYLRDRLAETGVQSTIVIIKTRGDQIQDLGFDKMEGKGFFTREIEEALLRKEIDIAVHSHKDLETSETPGLIVAAVSYREDPSELLLCRPEASDESQVLGLRENAVLGTSSARRKNQALLFRPDLQLEDLRGNVPTRVQKLREGRYDAILLAKAGVDRLGLDLSGLVVTVLDPRYFIPPPAQGVLAYQVREDDADAYELLAKIHNRETAETIAIERGLMQTFQGGCQLPLAVFCRKEADGFHCWASLAQRFVDIPRRIYLKAPAADGLVAQLKEQLQVPLNKKVLITRTLPSSSVFRKLLQRAGCTVHAQSFIEFESRDFGEVPVSDWIFFSSRNAVRFFLEKAGNPHRARLAAVGEATATAIRQAGYEVSFTGRGNDTEAVARMFKEHAGKERVLFPSSDRSVRTVQKALDPSCVVDLVTYHTRPMQDAAPDADILVFTSPSNVQSYLENNTIKPPAKIIAMGKTTGRVLEEMGVSRYQMPWSASEVALADAVLGNMET